MIAPKDPIEKRKGFFVMYKAKVEATKNGDGTFTQEIYLENRLKEYVRDINNISDNTILKLIENCAGIHKLVHSVGVSIIAEKNKEQQVNFVWQNYGKTNKYLSGTTITIPCRADGIEHIMKLNDFNWLEDDDIVGRFAFEFADEGELADVYVKFYVNDGYDVDDVTIEDEIDYNVKEYKEMIKNSLMNLGNNYRLKKVIEKAKNKEEVTIAYIGGSITQGAGAKPCNTNSYAYRSYDGFKKLFNTENVKLIKAGVGGTGSQLGIIRYNRDILRDNKEKPDIVVIEFAVNDDRDGKDGMFYESLVKKVLETDNKPAVVLLFSVFADDWNLQRELSQIGYRYKLPMVSIKNALNWECITKRQFFYDIFHPTNEGHKIMADSLTYLFEKVDESIEDKKDVESVDTVYGDFFKNIILADNINGNGFDTDLQSVEMDSDICTTPQFPYNWLIEDEFEWTFESKSLIMVFKDSSDNDFGKADVMLDGTYLKTLDPHINNWTHCNCAIIYIGKEIKKHVVKVKVCEKNKKFTVLGFGILR